MKYVVLLFGMTVTAMSAWGIFQPRALTQVVLQTWRKPWGMAFAVGVRLVLGAACILAAPGARYPLFYEIFGYLALAAAVAIPLIGKARLDRFIGYWADSPPALVRAWLLLGLVFGSFLVYGVV